MNFNYEQFLQTYDQVEQRTDEWFAIRKTIISATDVGTILGYNRFSSKNDLLKKKLSDDDTMIESPAIDHGVFFEPIATKCYENLKGGVCVHDVGLIIHPNLKWLGASPDGIMEDGRLLEIKCLYSRQFKNTDADIPRQYWAQIQIQLEVCDVEECDLYQCIFKKVDRQEYNAFDGIKGKEKRVHWILKDYRCNTIKRDRRWFDSVTTELYDFWSLINREQTGGKITNRIKRIKNNLGVDSSWISVNMIKNWMLNDPLIDWLNMYGDKSLMDKKPDIRFNFQYNLQTKKIALFKVILANLTKRFNISTITEDKECSIDNYNKTCDAIKRGVNIIHNGVLYDNENKIYGICDLIVRNDIIPQICRDGTFQTEESDIKQYSVIQFKYCTIELNKDGYINKRESSNYYKAECILLQRMLNKIQGADVECYILGKYINKNKLKYIGFKQLGIIDMKHKKDMELSKEVDNAINWLKRLRDDGANWNPTKPCMIELYPNMSSNMNEWTKYKKELAHKVKELTLVNGIGYDKRMTLSKEGITKWDDPLIYTKYEKVKGILDINNGHNGNITILNKEEFKTSDNSNSKTHNSNSKTHNKTIEFYVDFETINNHNTDYTQYESYTNECELLPVVNSEMIYLIGVGWEENDEWIFKKFMVNNLTYKEEKNIIVEWKQFMIDKMKEDDYTKMKLYHWTHAECRMYNNSCLRHSIQPEFGNDCGKWVDMYKQFKDNVYIRGAFDYSLKTIAKAMYNRNMISTKWEDEELNGLSTMIAIEYYNNMNCGLHNIKEVEEIVKYNEVDCKVMWEMIGYIQSLL